MKMMLLLGCFLPLSDYGLLIDLCTGKERKAKKQHNRWMERTGPMNEMDSSLNRFLLGSISCGFLLGAVYLLFTTQMEPWSCAW